MKFQIDHDYHIHSMRSLCSEDPAQTTDAILQYARNNGLRRICLTDHYWDESVGGERTYDYTVQTYPYLCESLPLPQHESVEFFFGCETDLRKDLVLGIPPSRYDDFSFIVIPTTHLHMEDDFCLRPEDGATNESRARVWEKRLDTVLHMDLPFHKVGIAHLACPLMQTKSRADYLETLSLISQDDMVRLFTRAAEVGCGIELNQGDMMFSDDEADTVLRMFRVAKDCGCKFYLASDAHHPRDFQNVRAIFARAIDLLDLQESDKFRF